MEAVLDRAAEVKRKSYRESLEQNRDAVLLSKELVTIDCHVPLPLDLTAMETQEPDLEACRDALHRTRIHIDASRTWRLRRPRPRLNSSMRPPTSRSAAFYAAARKNGFAFALAAAEPTEAEAESDEPAVPQTMSLLDVVEEAEKKTQSSIGVCAEPGKGSVPAAHA